MEHAIGRSLEPRVGTRSSRSWANPKAQRRGRRRPGGPTRHEPPTAARNGGADWWAGCIRTSVGRTSRFTACSLCPLGYRPKTRGWEPPKGVSVAVQPPRSSTGGGGDGAGPPAGRPVAFDHAELRRVSEWTCKRWQRGRPGAREISTRYDFKGTNATIELDASEIKLHAPTRTGARPRPSLEEKLVTRKVAEGRRLRQGRGSGGRHGAPGRHARRRTRPTGP